MSLHGKLVDVTTRRVGVEVVVSSTGTTVAVDDAGPLGEAGGSLTLYGQPVEYVAADLEAETVTLAAPLAVEAGDRLELAPAKVEVVATVRVDDDDDAVKAIVPLNMRMRLPEGVRDNPDTAETVLLDWVGNSLEVTDVVGDDGHVKTQWPIAPGGAFVSGDPGGRHTELNDIGFYTYRVGPNGMPYPLSWITSEEAAIGVADEDGTVLGGLNSMGDMIGRRVTANQSLSVGGRDLMDLLADLPRGIISSREIALDDSSAIRGTGVEIPSYWLSANLLAGRRYRIVMASRFKGHVVDGSITMLIRYAEGSDVPTISSPLIGHRGYTASTVAAGQAIYIQAEAIHSVATDRRATFRMTFRGDYGATPQRFGGVIYVEDVGPLAAASSGTDDDGAATALYTSTWTATASRRYDLSGNAMPGNDGLTDLWYWFGDPVAIENAAFVFGGGATGATDAGEIGKTIPSALAGATLRKAEIYIHNKSWWGEEEGHTTLAALGSSTLPATKAIDGTLYVPKFPAGSGVWVEVPTAWFTAGDGNLGVTLGDKDGFTLPGGPPAAPLTSGAMHGIGDPFAPQARFTYSR